MNKFLICFALTSCGSILSAQIPDKTINVHIENPWKTPKSEYPVVINLHSLQTEFTVKSAVVKENGKELPSQLDDLDFDMRADELAFVIDMPAMSKKTITISLSPSKNDTLYPPRVYAEMLLRTSSPHKYAQGTAVYTPGNTSTYTIQHHHGIAFESELVAYRIYFNEKQTTDLYGKFHKGLEIKESMFYPTDEQLKNGFGDDVILVRNSCGAGTLKGWNGISATHIQPVAYRGQRLIANGPVRTIADAEVKGWEYQGKELNMINRYTLYAGHRDVQIDVLFDQPLDKETFCTGVQNINYNADTYSDHKGLIASWGTDWPVNDTIKYKKETVGLATYIPSRYIRKETKDKENFLYVISSPQETHFRYYTMFTSCKETFGYPEAKAWFAYAEAWKESFLHPCKISIEE